MADLFDGIAEWLMEQALSDSDLPEIVAQMAARLTDGGVPIARLNIGRPILHPLFGLFNLKWEQSTGQVSFLAITRDQVDGVSSTKSPFADMMNEGLESIVAQLKDPDEVARYAMFQELADEGMTGYAAFARVFGVKQTVYAEMGENFRGTALSFCTKRFSGFSQSDLDGLSQLVTPLCICVRVANDRFLTSELLETYLGRISGKQVLQGHSARGNGQAIECALFYSDMRNSLGLSQSMEIDAYLGTVNQYFDCTAGAVLDHGGEVLKYIGDGVLAIFPIEGATRPRANMCAAALSAAREAIARAAYINKSRKSDGVPEIEFGIALHVGTVIYGNVGTEKRLDFTATGPAVGIASRCEGLTREIGSGLVATSQFTEDCPEPAEPLGEFAIQGFPDKVPLATYPTHSN